MVIIWLMMFNIYIYIYLVDGLYIYIWIIVDNVLNHQRLYGSIVHVYLRTQLVGGFNMFQPTPLKNMNQLGL